MTKIIAPNKKYNGISASVSFRDGEGYTDNPHLIKWFKEHGYQVEESAEKEDSKKKTDPKKKGKSKKVAEPEQKDDDLSDGEAESEQKDDDLSGGDAESEPEVKE